MKQVLSEVQLPPRALILWSWCPIGFYKMRTQMGIGQPQWLLSVFNSETPFSPKTTGRMKSKEGHDCAPQVVRLEMRDMLVYWALFPTTITIVGVRLKETT